MYKIYINETPLLLLNTSELDQLSSYDGEILKARYLGKTKFLLHYIDLLEKSRRFSCVCLYSNDEKQLFADFKKLFKTIKAAGGLVFNQHREALLIFRQGVWDLPKGKIEKGEGKKAAAIREVMEETGLREVALKDKLLTTYHTYRQSSGRRILKKSYWYTMYSEQEDLHPQTEEDIELAIWRSPEAFLADDLVVYRNIIEVMQKGTQ